MLKVLAKTESGPAIIEKAEQAKKAQEKTTIRRLEREANTERY